MIGSNLGKSDSKTVPRSAVDTFVGNSSNLPRGVSALGAVCCVAKPLRAISSGNGRTKRTISRILGRGGKLPYTRRNSTLLGNSAYTCTDAGVLGQSSAFRTEFSASQLDRHQLDIMVFNCKPCTKSFEPFSLIAPARRDRAFYSDDIHTRSLLSDQAVRLVRSLSSASWCYAPCASPNHF